MSAQLIQIGPFFHQGSLCGAALLEHYAAGTNTLKDIWSDSGETTTLAQPFVSDANGVFTFFADGAYKLIIKKSNGEVLYTIDNWTIQGAGESPTFSKGTAVATASSMDIGSSTWAHWTGSTNVSTLTGTASWYWAVADGNFTLLHSSGLLMPDSRNRKVLAGDTIMFVNEGANIWRLSGHMQKEGGWTGRLATTVAASSTLSVPTDGDFIDVSGGTTIAAIASASSGYRFRARFTGAGLNLTNSSALAAPWGRDYRTISGEVLEFTSLGSGNWIFWSLNGPKERIGTVISSDSPTAPPGFLSRDGSTVSRTTYPGLFVELGSGSVHGGGDGSTTFNLPDGRGRVDIQVDGSANRITSASTNGANADSLGGTGGAQTHTLVTAEMPSHTHTTDGAGSSGGSAGFTFSTTISGTRTSNATGGDGAHSNTQPWIAVQKYIRF